MNNRGVAAVTPKRAAAVIWIMAAVVFGLVVWIGAWSGTMWLAGFGVVGGLGSVGGAWWYLR